MVAKRDGKAYLLQQQYNVLQDGSVAVNLHSLDPITGQLLSVDSASCELSNSAIRIASVDRPRNKLLTIQELTAVQMQGRRISFFADLNDCTGEPKLIIGGTFADGSTLDRFASNGTFYGPLTELLREVDDGDDYFAWGSFNVYWFGDDNSFVVEGTVHRKPTWEVTLQTMWVEIPRVWSTEWDPSHEYCEFAMTSKGLVKRKLSEEENVPALVCITALDGGEAGRKYYPQGEKFMGLSDCKMDRGGNTKADMEPNFWNQMWV
ncbi:unnamed protein product [Notodromas monacha]|uniref:Uncharacterized protein n=1 Tax=Notodromas monacha TaxID=399045 RepID=A0A7R9BYR0_9CRUS|nr:unnamed protein product [Notodromas monacha]CAG0922909.1 unnamed protein product [Notodromas monacha]